MNRSTSRGLNGTCCARRQASCEGSVKDGVLAMVAVEKVFRMYRSPDAGPRDTIEVESEIDRFLREHFVARLILNIVIVVLFSAFYFVYLKDL